jgi:hypothetical protein
MVKDEGFKKFEQSGLNTAFWHRRVGAKIKTDYRGGRVMPREGVTI